jgi:hypothetical protein
MCVADQRAVHVCIYRAKYLHHYYRGGVEMSTLRKLNLELELGQTILVGPNGSPAEITKIEYFDKTGEITINTTRGPRKALTFRLVPPVEGNPADRYR